MKDAACTSLRFPLELAHFTPLGSSSILGVTISLAACSALRRRTFPIIHPRFPPQTDYYCAANSNMWRIPNYVLYRKRFFSQTIDR